MVDGDTSEWTSISGMPQGNVIGPPLFILHTSEMTELAGYRVCAYADDSTLLAVVRRPIHRRAYQPKSLARILQRCMQSLMHYTESRQT